MDAWENLIEMGVGLLIVWFLRRVLAMILLTALCFSSIYYAWIHTNFDILIKAAITAGALVLYDWVTEIFDLVEHFWVFAMILLTALCFSSIYYVWIYTTSEDLIMAAILVGAILLLERLNRRIDFVDDSNMPRSKGVPDFLCPECVKGWKTCTVCGYQSKSDCYLCFGRGEIKCSCGQAVHY